ncbi:3-deoxy-manno-octulosonate cytidylyltransferase [Nitrosococcus watsonii]|uniref:3-deoxy-manno-octulosonate cytidylyltransferase n=1 Tax=Nitrosococcus watsoni (strain C-113) TaxID=105559 RepID=D8K908_NITWC|nr:3-deoxy-manno-octulosonate cytidylyltransferase [Nitrosococcus watsonii]ADJ27218.1 3-deoxy-D-manno-octulosonate cytidylyltransferase [Nitrosococcus watsonii C-113]
MSYKVIIPARYGASRLPGKPLLDLAGKPMLLYVVEKAQKSGAGEVLVATDDRRIEAIAQGHGVQVCMTSIQHDSGTNRLAEVVTHKDYPDQTIIINVQGDEPLLPPSLIAQTAEDLETHPEADIATLCVPIANQEELFDPNIVKVVRDTQGYALYFSRAPIPWAREDFAAKTTESSWPTSCPYYRHIGLYAYRAGFLRRYPRLPASPLEQAECLEQLRVLYHGGRIHVAIAGTIPPPGVDTLADLERVRQLLAQEKITTKNEAQSSDII